MKRRIVVMIHVLLWLIIFYTFFNLLQAISGEFKNPDNNPYSDSALFIRTASTMLMLAIPFYSGYLISPYLFKKRMRKLVILTLFIFGLLFPLAMSVADDGFRLSALRQFLFSFVFLNLFMILGMGVRSLLDQAIRKEQFIVSI